jgi:vacuolar-type H+-ATPase subunit E/Vma4
MDENASGRAQLVEDITRDADEEARRIREEAAARIEERLRQHKRQLEEIEAEAARNAAAQKAAVEKTFKAALAIDLKRIMLHARDRVFKRILEGVEKKMAERVSTPEYRALLLGLVADEAEVNASPDELRLIDAAFLKEARDKVKELVLRKVTVTRSASTPLLLQGIVMSSADGRTAYNNQIRTRLLRNQSAIRKLIYERLQLS